MSAPPGADGPVVPDRSGSGAAAAACSGRIGDHRWYSFAARKATVVDMAVANSVVARMPAGLADPPAARSAMTPVGRSVTAEVLMARNSTIAFVAVPLCGFSVSSSCIARMPNGVAALPRPSALAEMFRIIAPIAG